MHGKPEIYIYKGVCLMRLINYATAYARMLTTGTHIRIVVTSQTTSLGGEFRFKHGYAAVYYIIWCIDNCLHRDKKPLSTISRRGIYGEKT